MSLMVSLLPLAMTPDVLEVLPLSSSCAPTMMSLVRNEVDEAIFAESRRSTARLKLAAVTGWPFENLKPERMVKVYVFPSLETIGRPAATSGCT